jgi:hypothetical protein
VLPLDVSVLQQAVLPGHVTAACTVLGGSEPGHVFRQEPVLHPHYAFVQHMGYTTKYLLYICIRFCVYKSFVLHLYVSVYKSFCAAPGCVCLEEPVLDLVVLSWLSANKKNQTLNFISLS